MESDYARRYAELNRRHWWWRAREGYVLRLLRDLRQPDGTARILDVGCGDGQLLDRLAPWGTAEGLETDRETLTADSARRRIHIGPLDDSFGTPGSRDLVLFLDVLEHLDDPVGALRRARTLLAPGGRIVVSVPAFAALWTSHDVLNHHRLRPDKAILRGWAAAAGLEVETARYLFLSVALAKVIQRALERLVPPTPALPRIPARPANALALAIARADLWLGRRLPLPVGSSLVATLRPVAGPPPASAGHAAPAAGRPC